MIIYSKSMARLRPQREPVPADWSFVQLGTTGEYDQQAFTVVGRIRLQLRNDYKNFWSVALADGAGIWLMESFASFAAFPMTWQAYNNSVRNLRAGEDFQVKRGLRLTGEFVEKCEGLGFEGEIGSWKLFESGFFLIQAANRNNEIGVFAIDNDKKDVDYLVGQKIKAEALQLKNTMIWNEWK